MIGIFKNLEESKLEISQALTTIWSPLLQDKILCGQNSRRQYSAVSPSQAFLRF
jgi:hypothetical protein